MRKLLSFASGVVSFAALVIACSSSDPKPPPSQDSEGGTPFEGGKSDGAADGDADNSPASCRDTMKNNTETDVDCGGDVCNKCALGKACTAQVDCAEGATCENKICALCKDGKKNGDETDVDCGGKACGPCGVGKACKAGTDCGSGACDTNSACACPRDMTIIPLSTGGAYCIDQSEALIPPSTRNTLASPMPCQSASIASSRSSV